jgi:ABC-2 type transport system ATP-binding protein
VTVRTNNLQETLHELLSWAHANSVELSGLDARSASLEEAFLAIAEEAA